MIFQNDPRLPEKIRKFGCNFRSLLAIAEFYCNAEFTVDDIKAAYNELVGHAMDEDCTMNAQLSLVTRWAFKRLGHSYQAVQVGIVYPPTKFEFWKFARVYSILKGVLHPAGYQGRSMITFHFRLGDRMGKTIFDPYTPPPAIVEEDCTLLYQVIE